MKMMYKNIFRQRIALLVLIFYSVLWSGNIFHHHHINLLTADSFTEQRSEGPISHSYSYDQNLSCTIHSNYVSISSVKLNSTIQFLPETNNEVFSIELFGVGFFNEPHLERIYLRAPPLS